MLALTVVGAASVVFADSDESLDKYLSRLGLDDLRSVHLEQVVDRLPAGDRQNEVARKLGDLYATQLMEAAADPQRYQDILRRVETLTAKVPAANSSALQLTLLQADYHRAETLARAWMQGEGSRQSLVDAGTILTEVAPRLTALSKQYAQAIETLTAASDDLDGEALQLKEQKLVRTELLFARSTYFAGWANYYYAIAVPDSIDPSLGAKVARQHFRTFLGLAEEDAYKELNVGAITLDREFSCLALIGLGMTEAALGNIADSFACFRLLADDKAAVPKYRDQVDFWLLRGLLNASRHEDAADFAKKRIDKLTSATDGKVLFCVALIRAGYTGEASEIRRELGQLGINGLARLRQFNLLRQAAKKFNINLSGAPGFYLQWLHGEQLAVQAKKTDRPEDYQAAVDALTGALRQPEVNHELADAAKCRRLLGGCLYELGRYELAAAQYERAYEGLRSADKKAAASALWMAAVSYRQLATKESRWADTAIEKMRTLKADFPNSPFAQNVDYEIAKIRRGRVSTAESIRQLQAIQPADPGYKSARYDLCAMHYLAWSSVKTHPAKAAAARRNLYQAVDKYLQFSTAGSDNERRVQCGIWAIDAALSAPGDEIESASVYLTRVQSSAAALDSGSSVRHDYRYRALQLATKTGDDAALQRHANWLADNAAGTNYAMSALTIMAKSSETAVQKAIGGPPEQLQQRQLEARQIFERLVAALGDSVEQIRSNKNARVASSRLAQYEYESGRYDQAAQRLEKLLTVYPTNKNYLRRSGLAYYNAKAYARALSCWRTLVVGLPSDSDDWYEAKYYQLACLAETDRAAAQKVMRQFKLLHPEMGPPAYRARLQQLDAALR